MTDLRYALYVFDFDGTLADTRRAVVTTYNATLEGLGLPSQEPDHIAALMGLPLGTTFERLGLPSELVATAVDSYRKRFPAVGTPLVRLFEGVLETLDTLRDRGASLAVASSRGRGSLHTLLAHLGIDDRFRAVVGEEDVVAKKPEPEAVLRILDAMAAPAARTVVVGDTVYDLEMGRAAGCATCAVSHGSHPPERLAPLVSDARHLLRRFEDLLGL